jgi:DNA-binding NtrC family response regulator
MTRRGTIALLGNLNIDRTMFDALAAEFDWAVGHTDSLGALREMSASQNVAAVLFDARSLGVSWNDALESVLAAAPRALPIVCTGFSEPVRWSELADAGAFHELRLPINKSEARCSLGFIWAAKRWDRIEHDAAAASQNAPGAIWRKPPATIDYELSRPVIKRAPRLYVK